MTSEENVGVGERDVMAVGPNTVRNSPQCIHEDVSAEKG